MKNCSCRLGQPVLVLALAGVALGLGACSTGNWFSSNTTPDPALNTALNTDKPVPTGAATSMSVGGPGNSGTSTATTTPMGAPVPGTAVASNDPSGSTNVIPRRAGKIDPFWIEVNAENDRATWAGKDPIVSSAGLVPDAKAIASSVTLQPRATEGDELAEGLTRITTAPEGADFDPCVSRDGKFMVFASTQHRPTAAIYMKSTNGRTLTQLTSDPSHNIMPTISPDGKRIAYCSNRNGNWDIFVMSATGGQAVQITGDASHELHPSWSPDGTRLAFCRLGQISGRWEMWVTSVQNGTTSEFVGYGLFPQWCPTASTGMNGSDKLLFQRSRERGGRGFSIWTVDYKPGDTSSPTEIASSPTAAMINPAWSPDGSRIVFATVENPSEQSTNVSGPQTVASDLWMVNIDGSARVNLTSGGNGMAPGGGGRFMNLMPWWAADGRIYFVSDRSGVANVWSMGTEKAIQAATSGNSPLMPQTAHSMTPKVEHPEMPTHPESHSMAPAQVAIPPLPTFPAHTPGMTPAHHEPAPIATSEEPKHEEKPMVVVPETGHEDLHKAPLVSVPEENTPEHGSH